jgi:hypothetical protein|tara:strand:- start:1037 stop:2266 length:1230 start_codon:yes stop_codon:yes gene_type:complete
MITIEDYIEILAGIQDTISGSNNFVIDRSDYNLVTSLARQTFRGIPLTDRQYELTKQKLLEYKTQFESNNIIDIEINFNNLRMPLRSIDRSRWVKIVDFEDDSYIGVRFTFNKKLISALEVLGSIEEKNLYNNEEKIHFYTLTEINLYKIINVLLDKNFEIQHELTEKYETLKEMKSNKNNYIPGIYSLKLKNVHSKAFDYAISTIGEPDVNNLALYKDRSQLFGIKHFDDDDLNNSISKLTELSQKIVKRSSTSVLVNSSVYNFDRVAETLLELNRYPLLVLLNDAEDYDNMQKVYHSFRNIFSDDSFCTLYRKDNNNQENIAFNQYIKDNKLNNSLDYNSKVVYTTINKMSKTIIKSNWKPQAAILMGSVRQNPSISAYLSEVDLVIHYDTDLTPWQFSSRETIERL